MIIDISNILFLTAAKNKIHKLILQIQNLGGLELKLKIKTKTNPNIVFLWCRVTKVTEISY